MEAFEKLGKLVEQMGIAAESVQRLKFGRGVVGKITVICGAAVIAIGAISLRLTEPFLQMTALWLVLGIFLLALGAIIWFAKRHPDLASLEGAELILWHQLRLGAKGISAPPEEATPITDPAASPPAITPAKKDEEEKG